MVVSAARKWVPSLEILFLSLQFIVTVVWVNPAFKLTMTYKLCTMWRHSSDVEGAHNGYIRSNLLYTSYLTNTYPHKLLQQACCSLHPPYSEGPFLIHCQHTQGGWTLYPCSSHPANVLLLLLVQGSLKERLKAILLWMSCKLVNEQSHFLCPIYHLWTYYQCYFVTRRTDVKGTTENWKQNQN